MGIPPEEKNGAAPKGAPHQDSTRVFYERQGGEAFPFLFLIQARQRIRQVGGDKPVRHIISRMHQIKPELTAHSGSPDFFPYLLRDGAVGRRATIMSVSGGGGDGNGVHLTGGDPR